MTPRGYRRSGLLAMLAVGAVGCTNNSTGPTVLAVIKVLSGASQTDTIQAELATAVLVEVHGTHGELVSNATITFTSLGPTTSDSAVALVSAASPAQYGSSLSATTNASGQASALVRLGTKVGVAHIAVAVASLNVADTVPFTVDAGAFVTNIAIGPADTAIYQNGHVTLASGLDRFGNPSNHGLIAVGSVSGPLSVSGATVTASAYGVGSINFTVNSTAHVSKITVVPQARIAAGGAGGIVIFNTDGSSYRTFGSANTSDLKYSPSGGMLAVDQWPFSQTSLGYTTDTLTGTLTQLDPSLTPTSQGELFPQFSRDGQWIYFGSYDASYKKRLWRVHPDGTGSAQVPASDSANYDDINPSPSPDGTQLVYVVDQGGGNTHLNTVTIATGVVTAIFVPGHAPTWAPTGNVIAFVRPPGDFAYGPLYVMNSDGTNQRELSATNYGFTVDWSPDAQWIVGAENPSGRIDLVNVSSGLVLPLDFTSGLLGPTWHP